MPPRTRKTLGQVAYEARWRTSTVWEWNELDERARMGWERAAKVVERVVKRRQQQKEK